MKKLVSLLLVALLVFGIATPICYAADKPLPVIYIVGKQNTPVYKIDENGDYLLNEKGERIVVDNVNTPLGMERGEYILSQVEPVLSELVMALLSDDYSAYIDALVASFAAPYKDAVLDKDGTSSTTAIDPTVNDLSLASTGAGGYKYYFFRYDWRYSPFETADLLNEYIEAVCEKEGVSKVNMHARCYGSNVALAYMAKAARGDYDSINKINDPDYKFRINNLALNTTPIAGYYVIGALMSGSVTFNADVIDRYISLFLEGDDIFDDPTMEMLAVTLISVTNQIKVLGLTLDKVQEIYDKIADELVPQLALVSYGSFPSYWSMIGDDYFEKAKMMVFKTSEPEGEYAEMIRKINSYHDLLGKVDENGEAGYAKVLKECADNYGMKVCILAKYGYQSFPFFEGSELSGDGRGTVTALSLGALGNVIHETFTDKELQEIKALDGYDEKYLSPDKQVYAGTCLFPDTTWFSRNLGHSQLHEIDPIVTEFFRTNGALTAVGEGSLEKFPQFFNYNNGQFEAVEGIDESHDDAWADNPFLAFIRFFRVIFEMITSFLKKN